MEDDLLDTKDDDDDTVDEAEELPFEFDAEQSLLLSFLLMSSTTNFMQLEDESPRATLRRDSATTMGPSRSAWSSRNMSIATHNYLSCGIGRALFYLLRK